MVCTYVKTNHPASQQNSTHMSREAVLEGCPLLKWRYFCICCGMPTNLLLGNVLISRIRTADFKRQMLEHTVWAIISDFFSGL